MNEIIDTSGWFHWDPSPNLFNLPFIDRAIAWYGLFFAFGFLMCYIFSHKMLGEFLGSKSKAADVTDQLLWYIVIGTVVGARLGHVFFYGLPSWSRDPWAIFRTWEGGLASHGAAVGIILAGFLFRWRTKKDFPSVTMFVLSDVVCLVTGFAGGCIRIGNFFNQEIVGTVTKVPWAVVFGHPHSGLDPLPRHPVQLYESVFYFVTFLLLHHLWKSRGWKLGTGMLSGLALTMIFTFRFFIEFLKVPQSLYVGEEPWLLMGQYLSLPFIAAGAYLLYRSHSSLRGS